MFTEANMETAMALWEEFTEHRDDPLWKEDVEQCGTSAFRHTIIALVPECERIWEALREAGKEDAFIPFDWEWCPYFLRNVVQWDGGPVVPADALDKLLAEAEQAKRSTPDYGNGRAA